MGSDDGLARLRDKFAAIERENSERMALIEKRAAQAKAESKENSDKLLKTAGGVLARLNERTRRAKAAGGWATNTTTADPPKDEDNYEFLQFDEPSPGAGHPLPEQTWTPPPPPPPPAPAAAPAAPRRRAAPADDDEDFAEHKWWAG